MKCRGGRRRADRLHREAAAGAVVSRAEGTAVMVTDVDRGVEEAQFAAKPGGGEEADRVRRLARPDAKLACK